MMPLPMTWCGAALSAGYHTKQPSSAMQAFACLMRRVRTHTGMPAIGAQVEAAGGQGEKGGRGQAGG